MEERIGVDGRDGLSLVRGALVAVAFGVVAASSAKAATYLPIPDAALAQQAPVIVRARAGDSFSRLEGPGPGPGIVTVTEFQILEMLKGTVATGSMRLVLPGGQVEDLALWIPGRPRFAPGQEVVLFVAPLPGRPGEFGPTEFALSVFDLLSDTEGRRFAVRTMFQAGEEEVFDPNGSGLAEPDHLRDAKSFVAALRAVGRGEAMPSIQRRSPAGPLQPAVQPTSGVGALWVNIGGPEGSGTQFKWFWGTGSGCSSPNGVVNPVGTQTNLTDGSNGLTHVQNAASEWSSVAGTDVRYSYSPSGGNVDVSLDVSSYSGGWTEPMTCSLGVLGFGGTSANCIGTFNGESFASCNQGSVSMRRSTCSTGYTAAVFRSAVLHEVGHTLGLGHPDQGTSSHSTTSSSEWNAAVMRSFIPEAHPDTPQSDDIAAIGYYYGTGGPPPAPVANFSVSPSSPVIGQTVSFTDTSTNTPTSWAWSFGDPASGGANTSTLRNPTHSFASAGTYTVRLTATNGSGSGFREKPVTVTVPPAPTANFTFSPPSPAVSQNVQFHDTSTGNPTSWSWDFGDGGTSTAQNPGHAFSSAGSFAVTLVATNTSGSNQKLRTVTVSQPAPPVAAFTFSPVSPVAGQQVSFVDQSTGVPTSYLWTFGDGTTSTSANPVKAYAVAGTYTVTLQVSNSFGTNSASKQVPVSAPGSAPVASFTFSPASPQPGQAVQYTDTSTGGPTRWSWDFGDGTFSAEQNPAKTYSFAGTLTVRLYVENAYGSNTTTRSITIASTANRPPVAAADAYTVGAGATLTVNPPGVLGNDSDPDGDALTAVLVSPPGSGTVGLQPSGAFTYTPAAGFVGTDSFPYRAVDARGEPSDPALVTITVSGAEAERVIPIVLDAFGVGTSRFRSELVLANRGTTPATVELTYTAATALNASGSGAVTETLAGGRQLVLDDALAYLRTRGLLIPQAVAGASQGGTLRARFHNLSSPDAGAAFARTTALLPQGRAGVAYPALVPAEWAAVPAQHVFGLRETGQERSNLAMANLGSTGDVELRVTLASGSRSDRRTFVLPETIWLRPLQWTQLGSVLARAGFTNGWALVERVAGTEPFYAYGVFNDHGTNDGSFIDPIPAASTETARTVPVVLELGIYTTELILANPTASDVDVSLRYVESLSAAGVARRVGTDFLRAREQKVVEAMPHLRGLGVDIGAAGGSYAGSIVATFTTSGQPATGFAGARTKSPGEPQGSYGVYYSGLGAGQAAPSEAWVFGLRQDGDSRTNVAIVHAEPGGAPLTLQAEIFDGETGASAGRTGSVSLAPGQWFQWNQILGSFGLRQGYARILRVAGTSPFLAYGVVNDGGSSRPGTNDGSYVPMLPGR
jgi:PKD repeat protein